MLRNVGAVMLGNKVTARMVERGTIMFFGVLCSLIYVWVRFPIKGVLRQRERHVAGARTDV